MKQKANSAFFFKKGENQKREIKKGGCRGPWLVRFFLERENLSLESWEIRPSAVVGTRRKPALRGEANAWVPNLRSLDKLREVGVSPYLGFILHLSTL